MKKFTYILLVLAVLTGISIALKQPSAGTTEAAGSAVSEEETVVNVEGDIEVGADADEKIDAVNVVEENPEETSDEEETIIHE